MKKKLCLILALTLAAVLCLTGCGKKTTGAVPLRAVEIVSINEVAVNGLN